MYQQVELAILVKNKPIRKYQHEGNTFVEGRNGTEYVIRINNHYGRNIEAIISVDGLSILNGEEASDASSGYLVQAYRTLDIPCWKINGNEGAKFCFSTKDQSYSASIGKGTHNIGVIGARIFCEKTQPVYRALSASNSLSPSWNSNTRCDTNMNCSVGALSTGDAFLGMNTVSANAMQTDPSLGTGFGQAMQWDTYEVAFTRDTSTNSTLVIYYDTRKNLERRGIRVESPSDRLPSAFPGNSGCPVPQGWERK